MSCPDDRVCATCYCESEDYVCLPDERLRAEHQALMAGIDQALEALRVGDGKSVRSDTARDALTRARRRVA